MAHPGGSIAWPSRTEGLGISEWDGGRPLSTELGMLDLPFVRKRVVHVRSIREEANFFTIPNA